jgi:DNA-binding winged helix-turn-helix (wHTH) protein/predicted ATPase
MIGQQNLRFGSFRLDLLNQQLWRGEQTVPLRPKTSAVLRYLVEHAGRLVTRDELVRAVWSNAPGSEKAPKRCILELREALGDRVDEPLFIETMGRVGYRFIAQLTMPGSDASAPRPPGSPPGVQTPTPPLVGRQPELAQLDRSLAEVLAGERRVVFITGEPGIGKTSVVESFLRQVSVRTAGRESGGLLVAHGQCIEQYGEGEAYLPVLEALGRLAAGSGNGLVRDLLWRSAPSWLAQLPALVSEGELEILQRRLQGATQSRMLREITDLVGALSAQVPLILVIEDLHWSDHSTLDFISSVAQRREQVRLQLIGTYRLTEMGSDHPLRAVVQELLSHGQARELLLPGISAAAVEQYLDARFPRHCLSAELAQLLRRVTGGNPLFLVNLVEDLIAQELISQVDGQWALRVPADAVTSRVPENSRRLIERQIARVPADVQPLLEAASVAGMEFSAEVVASALDTSAERIEQHCDDLVRQELFLRRTGVDEWPDGLQTTRYAFRHAVYQQLWSDRVPTQRQQRLHRRIGERLEKSYGRRAVEIAAELAEHFDEGRDHPRAVEYHHCAAQTALRRSAHREAIAHLTKALQSLGNLPDTAELRQQELGFQILLGVPLAALKGYAAPELERAYTRALELSEQVQQTSQTVQALLGLWVFYAFRGELRTARELGERALAQTVNPEAAELALDAHNALGTTLLWLGDLTSAREQLQQTLALHGERRQRSFVLHDVTDPGVGCLSNLSWTLWYLGYPDQALARGREARALAEELSHPYSLGYALNFGAALHCYRREARQTEELAEATVALCNQHGFPFWQATATILRSWSQAELGKEGDQPAEMRRCLTSLQEIGAVVTLTAFLALLAQTLGDRGEPEEGLTVLAKAHALAEAKGERLFDPEIHRLAGELTLQIADRASTPANRAHGRAQLSRAAGHEAEGHFLKAIGIAKEQQAKSWELRSAMSLARLWRRQRRAADARALLSEVYAWFTEGFDTADLIEARALLREPAHEAR